MHFTSSTQAVPVFSKIPRHVAIIMDGNGRWADKHYLPRPLGHKKGVQAALGIVKACSMRRIDYLTLFAFSSENWRRPAKEVSFLIRLFMSALKEKINEIHENNIRLKVIGDFSSFPSELQTLICHAQQLTVNNQQMTVTICANYGGRWDILEAIQKALATQIPPVSSIMPTPVISEETLSQHLALAYAPEPDLFIRTGGEQRISNFLLWQLAYSELYFTDTFWPDFDADELDKAIQSYQQRERRFGCTSAQAKLSALLQAKEQISDP